MIELGAHWEFIVGGYLATAVVVGAVIAWTVIDSRRVEARVIELEAKRGRAESK